MNTQKSLPVIFLRLLLIFATPTILTASSLAISSEPDTSSSHTVWVGGRNALLAIHPQNGSILKAIPVPRIQAVAADSAHGVIWAYGAQTLHAFTPEGSLLFSRNIDFKQPYEDEPEDREAQDDDMEGLPNRLQSEDDCCGHRRPQLIVQPQYRRIWLVRGSVLRSFNEHGEPMHSVSFRAPIRAVSLDSKRNRFWVVEQGNKEIIAWNDQGAEVARIDPEGQC